MSICVKSGKHCCCQPDEGLFCEFESVATMQKQIAELTEQVRVLRRSINAVLNTNGTALESRVYICLLNAFENTAPKAPA
jgi:hypothetical protein